MASSEVAPAVINAIPPDAWPVIYSAGFAGVVCLILLWILFNTLTRHTEAQIKNTAQLEEIARDLKEIVRAFASFQAVIERRR